MFDLTLNENDKNWLEDNYPDLVISTRPDGIEEINGVLKFNMAFENEEKPFVINPTPGYSKGTKIYDEYRIKIEFQKSNYSNLPQVYEMGSKIEKVAEEKELKPEDLHINPGGPACLCIKPKEKDYLPDGFNLKDFMNYLLIPFFYAQSYYSKYGSWPWGQYSHGILGYLELHLENADKSIESLQKSLGRISQHPEWQAVKTKMMSRRGIKGHHRCICGKELKIRNCHPAVLRGIWKLRQDIISHSLTV